MTPDVCRPVEVTVDGQPETTFEDFTLAPGYHLPVMGRGVVWADVVADIATEQAQRLSTGPKPAGSSPVLVSSPTGLVRQARATLADAQMESSPAWRFALAYLAALRAAGAVLVLHGRPHRGRSRPADVWGLVARLAPDMAERTAFFASCAPARASILAGITSWLPTATADDLVRQAGEFVDVVAALAGVSRPLDETAVAT